MPSESSHVPNTALLKHLDRVYEMARVLAPTEKQASKLVEATFRRAAQSTAPAPDAVRAWLLRLLLQTYATRRSDAGTTSSVSTMRRPADLLQDFRFHTAEHALQRAVPVAFALRSPREQLVLTLCDILGLAPREAALVLDTDPPTVQEEAAAAREALWNAVRDELTPGEFTLVDEELPDGSLQEALSRVVAPHLGPLPPTLRPSVAAIVEQPSPQEAAPDPPPDRDDSPADRDDPPAAPSPRRSPTSPSPLGERLQQFGLALVIILATGLTAYLAAVYLVPDTRVTPTDLIHLSAQQADAVRPNLETDLAADAERFIAEQLGRNIEVPRIDSARLRGVSIVEMRDGIRVPAFVFDDILSDRRITTYAYTYAVIDRFGEQVDLPQAIREELQREQRINLHTADADNVLVWRVRDDIYVAVTKADPRQVRSRITPSTQAPRGG